MKVLLLCILLLNFLLVFSKPASDENEVEKSLMKDILERAFGGLNKTEGLVNGLSKKNEVNSFKKQPNERVCLLQS